MKDNMEGQSFSAWSFLSYMICHFGTLGFKASLVFQNGLRIQHDSYVDVLHECKTEEKEKNPRKLSWKYLHVLMAVIALILCNNLFVIMRGTSDDQGTYVLPWRHKAHITDMKIQKPTPVQTDMNHGCFIRQQSHTTIDIRMDQHPNEIFAASSRSQILRKFRRSTQTMLLELIYKSRNQSMPMNPYKDSPPGWSEYKPDIEFRNISNSRSGEEEIFNKMVFLLQNKSQVPFPNDLEVCLEHYNNLNEKREQQENKKALENWMLLKNLSPLLQEYSKKVDVPPEEIVQPCFAICLKSSYFHQFIVKHADEELSNDQMRSCETSQNEESLEPRAKISECTIALNQRYDENQSMEIPHSLQGKRRRRSEESTSINPVPSESNSCLENMDIFCDDNQDKISNFNILSEKDYDEITLDFYEPDILLKYLEKYLRDLGNNRPSPRMVTLCNDILKKDQGHIDSHTDFFRDCKDDFHH